MTTIYTLCGYYLNRICIFNCVDVFQLLEERMCSHILLCVDVDVDSVCVQYGRILLIGLLQGRSSLSWFFPLYLIY